MNARENALVLTHIRECLDSTKEAYSDAVDASIPNARDRMYRLYGDLIDLEQDFRIYSTTVAEIDNCESYESILNRYEDAKQSSSLQNQAEKDARLREAFNEGGQGNEEDEVSFAGGESKAGLICPLTQKLPEQPVVSRLCQHVFEKDAIVQYVHAHSHGKVKSVVCPVAGCTVEISVGDLIQDPRVNAKVAQARHAQDDDWENTE